MKVAVVGATGLVGSKMLQVLAERNFPVTELIPVASERSVGKEVEFKGVKYKVVGYADAIAARPDVALFSAGGSTSLELAPKFAEAGITEGSARNIAFCVLKVAIATGSVTKAYPPPLKVAPAPLTPSRTKSRCAFTPFL